MRDFLQDMQQYDLFSVQVTTIYMVEILICSCQPRPSVRGSAIDPIGTASDANLQRWWKGVHEPVGAYYFLFSVEFNSHPNTIPLQRLLISGTIPPLHFLRIRVPARSCNKQAGSFDPPCCKNFVLIAEPVVRDKGSSLHISCHMVAAKLFA